MSDRPKILYATSETHAVLRKLATASSRTMIAELASLVSAGQERSTSFMEITARFDMIERRIAMLEAWRGGVK